MLTLYPHKMIGICGIKDYFLFLSLELTLFITQGLTRCAEKLGFEGKLKAKLGFFFIFLGSITI